jgi:7-keto-8-aminopelargonate synthetase-like enzyme
MFSLSNHPGRIAIINGKECLFFSGYGYLGMQDVPAFTALVKEGIDKYGWLFPSSRISNTQLAIFDEMETLLNKHLGTAETVCMPSGFSAGTVAATLYKGHPTAICPEAHPAINKIQQPPQTFDKWAEQTLHALHEKVFDKTPVLITDAVNPLTGEVNDMDFLHYIEKPLIVIVDDSHGIGIIGEHGTGIASLLPKKANIEYIITYSLSKAIGMQGGAISCTNTLVANSIRQMHEYTASTSLSPALAYAFIKGQALYQQQRKQLLHNIARFRPMALTKSYITNDERLPIFVLPPHLDATYFARHQVVISSFAYPDMHGKKVNRIVLNALHTQQDLEQLAQILNSQ